MRREEKQKQMVDQFNRWIQIGHAVKVKLDDGTLQDTVTESEAWLLGGHTAVIKLRGISGGYSLERVNVPDPMV